MKKKHNYLINISLALIVASLFIFLSKTVFFKRIELVSLDAFFRMRMNPPKPFKDIVVIEVTNDNVLKVGRWPWSRRYLVTMIKALKAFGARDILYDFLIAAQTNKEDDAQLQESVKKAGNVYLPIFLEGSRGAVNELIKPMGRLMADAKGVGFVNIIPDVDGSFRRIPLYYRGQGRIFYNITLRMAMDQLGLKAKRIRPREIILGNDDRELHIPLVAGNSLLLNWYGPWESTFRRYNFLEIIRAYEDVMAGKPPAIDLRPLKDKICIVALTAVGLYDIKSVPVQTEYPGAGIAITALSNILNQDFLYVVPFWVNILLIYFVSFIPAFLLSVEKPGKAIIFVVSGLAVFLLTYYLFLKGYKIIISTPMLTLFASDIVINAYNFISPKKIETHEKEALRLQQWNKDLCANLKTAMDQKENLEKINHELGQFVHTVGHDIRSPLLCLTGYAEMLQNKIQDNLSRNDKELIEGIFNSIDHLNDMMNSLLETTKRDRIDNPYEKVDFNGLLTMIENRLEFMIKDYHVDLDIQKDLPVIVCDRIKMGEVFHNLIVNAVKFSSVKTDRPRIEVRYHERPDFHEFMVKDNGIGIDPKHHHEIFEMFKSISSSKESGHGVGLSIVHTVIKDQGGDVWVESEKEKGAAFFFTIPKGLKIKIF